MYLQMYLYVHVLYIMLPQEFCVYIFLVACSSKKLFDIAQLHVGYVTVCSAERTIRVLWRSVARHGWSRTSQHGIIDSVFNTEPRWAKKVELKRNVTEDLFQSGQISNYGTSMVKSNSKCAHLGKNPNLCC
jgi:hypothetical protein